nr:hypothetical protein [Actinoplanes toevensis]
MSVLNDLTQALVEAGEIDRAERLAELLDRDSHSYALRRLAEALIRAGDFDRAGQIADAVRDRSGRAQVLARFAVAVARSGDQDRARRVADQAETLAGPSATWMAGRQRWSCWRRRSRVSATEWAPNG